MAEDRKIVMSKTKAASYNNPHVIKAISMLSANPNGEKLLTYASVGKRNVYDIREWSSDRSRADKFGVQIAENEVEDFAYALLPFVNDNDIVNTFKSRGLSLDTQEVIDFGIDGLDPIVKAPAQEAPKTEATPVQEMATPVLTSNASADEVKDFFASATLEQLEYEIARRKFEGARN